MERIDQPGQVDNFLRDVAVITARSWKAELDEPAPEMAATPEVLRAAAAAGFLRAYLLRARGEPAAYALGYRYGDIYHYANIAYDSQFATFSPGAVLLLMMIEDLVDKAGIRFMNFGITDAGYKRVFGNRHIADASVIVMKPTLRNAALRVAHLAFESGKRALKRRTRGAASAAAASPAEAEA
jgi:CelD/BcsL family acetyltransferase involved in cellulose biosynthesis